MRTKPDQWVGNAMKERRVKRAIRAVLLDGNEQLDELFDLIKARDEYR
jgi:type I restriction enzyme R subunit